MLVTIIQSCAKTWLFPPAATTTAATVIAATTAATTATATTATTTDRFVTNSMYGWQGFTTKYEINIRNY